MAKLSIEVPDTSSEVVEVTCRLEGENRDLLGCMAVGCVGRYGRDGKISCRFASPNLQCGSNIVVAN